MKKTLFIMLLIVIGLGAMAQQSTRIPEPQWTKVISDTPEAFQTQLISSTENSILVNVQVPGFYTATVTTPKGEAFVITVPKAVSTAHAGEPDVPMTGIPVMIGDKAQMSARVIDAQYMDFENIEVAPSKGDFPRSIDPATVPYTYGECYKQDAFFPASNVGLYEPYIIREVRGQNIVVYPFAYNPVTKTLRVYYNMTVEMYKVDDQGTNVIESRRSTMKLDPDFKNVYQRHFINYEASMDRYTPVDEEGDLLIICYDNFISSMTDFVNWKKTRGVNTTIVGTSTAGSSYTAIKNYIQSQYNANNNLTHVLLVGDVAQIPGYSYSGGGSSYSGLGDNAYGQIVGSDNYNDVFIGRFSASSAARVTTQCNRVITYERDLTTSANWLQVAEGIAKKEGGSGHNGEDDYQHMDVIRTDLLNYGYSTVYQRYENLSGYTATASQISSDINSGVGIVNYCNHGAETMWGVASYSVSHVNALTNENKLPFIWSVACLVGKYDHSSDCFAEAWMNATNNNNPTGAIGTLMSYISQPWIPPMWAQDECVDILAGLSSSGGTKHTWGGVSINGLFGIFDNYGSDQSAVGTYQAWILYGDPSMMIRTKTPQAMTVTHNGSISVGSSVYTVNVSNGNGAVATITDANHNILGKATVSNGTANVSISGNLTPGTELTLCVFGFNKVTYLGTISVVGGTQYAITVTQPQHGTISAPAQAYANSIVTLSATPETGYCLSSWSVKKGNTNITVTNNQFTMPEGDVTVTATFVTGLNVTLAPATNGTISADPTCALQGTTINLTATPATSYVFDSWVVYKTGDASTTVNVSGNSFTMPAYGVTVVGVFLAPQGGDVTIGSGTNANAYLPTYTYYNYSLTQQIYTSAEVGNAGTITAVAFQVANSKSTSRTIDVYLSHTSNSSFSGNSAWVSQSTSNRVFSGSVNFASSGWTTITLDTPFEYNGTSNLLLTVDDNTGSYISNSESPSFLTYSTNSTNRAIYKYNDNTNYNPASMSTSGTLMAYNNQVVFTKEVPSTDGYLSVSPASLTGFEATSGATASNPQSVAVIGANLQANLTVTAPNGYEVSTSQSGTYNSTLTLTPSNGSIQTNVFVRLGSGVSAGTYNGNMTMVSGNTSATVSLSGTVLQGAGTSYEITATANPTAGGTVTGAGTYYENGTCTLIATANTGYTFTNWTKNGSVVSTSASYSFNVDENHAGAYVANFTINSYMVTATANPAEGGTISGTGSYNHGTTASLTATASEGYTFTGWKKGNTVVSTNAVYSFIVTEATTLVANFTVNSYDVTVIANPEEGGTVTIVSEGGAVPAVTGGVGDTLTYDFEDGWQGWTTFQGTTTSPDSWMHNTSYPTSNNNFSTGYGHNSSDGFMLSESYISGTSSGAGTAVTPDNYLVSPQVRLGGSISFYAGARNTEYCAEKFSVMVSTTDNTNPASFTTLGTWTLSLSSAGYNSTPYTVDLSAYSGMGYIAIRHFDCYDQWFLCIDNVTIVEGEDQSTGGGSFNYGETCTVTATPNTDYHFVNWTENDVAVSSDASYTFTVTGDRDLVANFSQTLPESCYAPTDVTVSNVGRHNAVVGWTENGEATSWVVAYKPTSDQTFAEAEASANSFTLSGLAIRTSYDVKVRPVCESGEEKWSEQVTFTTESCYMITLDAETGRWEEDFEGYATTTEAETGEEPDCWEVVHEDVALSASTKPQVYCGFATSGSYSLRMRNRCVYAMPELSEELDVSSLTMTFSLRQPKTSYSLQVGVVDTAGNFEMVWEVNNTSTGIESVSVDFTNYTGLGRRIAFRNVLKGKRYEYSYNYIDDITLTYTPEAVCEIDSVPYEENFEGYTGVTSAETGEEPDCWEVISEDVALDASTRPQLYRGFATSGNYSLRMRNRCVYAMPALDADISVNVLTMTFNLRQPKTFYRLQVGVVDADSNFVMVEEINNLSLEMEPVSVDFADYTGTGHRIAFRNVLKGKRYDYSYNYIDDIRIDYTANIVEGAKSESDMPEGADAEYLERIAVYPNPTTGMLQIDAVDVQKVECYSQMGQLVGVYENVNELNLGDLAKGVYMLRITVPQGVTVRKVVKR